MTKETREKRGKDRSDSLIKNIRMALGLSVTKLANLADVEYFDVYRAETCHIIRPDKAYKIANALNISPDIIFYCIGQMPKDKVDLMKKDPLSFKEKIDELCEEPWRLTKTKDYIQTLQKSKVNPEIKKILSRLKTLTPTK